MEERLNKEIEMSTAMYRDFYNNDFAGKQVADIPITKIERMKMLRYQLRMLYWIKGEIYIDFEEDKIIIKESE